MRTFWVLILGVETKIKFFFAFSQWYYSKRCVRWIPPIPGRWTIFLGVKNWVWKFTRKYIFHDYSCNVGHYDNCKVIMILYSRKFIILVDVILVFITSRDSSYRFCCVRSQKAVNVFLVRFLKKIIQSFTNWIFFLNSKR